MDIEISEKSDSVDSDDDDDDGEVGELEGEEGEEGEEEELGDDGIDQLPRSYQHEPEPLQPVGLREQGLAIPASGDGVGFRLNRDVTRLDPRNTDNW